MEYAARRKSEMNCCQAVLVAFADKLGKGEDELLTPQPGLKLGDSTEEDDLDIPVFIRKKPRRR